MTAPKKHKIVAMSNDSTHLDCSCGDRISLRTKEVEEWHKWPAKRQDLLLDRHANHKELAERRDRLEKDRKDKGEA